MGYGYIVKLEGRGGLLDCRTVETEAEIKGAVQDIVLNCELAPGDVIRIDEIAREDRDLT
jgi:hypothetical protein